MLGGKQGWPVARFKVFIDTEDHFVVANVVGGRYGVGVPVKSVIDLEGYDFKFVLREGRIIATHTSFANFLLKITAPGANNIFEFEGTENATRP